MTATMMFTDIVESTTIAERRCDSMARSVLRTGDAIIRHQMHAYSGAEVKGMGDCYMLTFPGAKSGTDCALSNHHEIADFNACNPAIQIAARIGLSAGETIVEDSDMFGNAGEPGGENQLPCRAVQDFRLRNRTIAAVDHRRSANSSRTRH